MAQASVYDFLSNFKGGGVRPNRYRVQLSFPQTVANRVAAAKKISFTCQAASIPESTLNPVDVPYMGRQVKIPGDKVWGDWTVQIMLDTDFIGRSVFEQWQDQLLGFRTNVAQPMMLDPMMAYATADIITLDRSDKEIQRYKVYGMFPTMVGEIQLGYDQNDQIALQPVTFAINGWESSSTRF